VKCRNANRRKYTGADDRGNAHKCKIPNTQAFFKMMFVRVSQSLFRIPDNFF